MREKQPNLKPSGSSAKPLQIRELLLGMIRGLFSRHPSRPDAETRKEPSFMLASSA
jgi:hypothetical protein